MNQIPGIDAAIAAKLVHDDPEECVRQLEGLRHRNRDQIFNLAGFLIAAVRGKWPIPVPAKQLYLPDVRPAIKRDEPIEPAPETVRRAALPPHLRQRIESREQAVAL